MTDQTISYVPLVWRELKEREYSNFNCLLSDTSPFGEIRIEWKGWTGSDDKYVVLIHGVHIGIEHSLEEAKALAQKWNNETIRGIVTLCDRAYSNIMPAIALAASQAHQYASNLPIGDDRTEAFEIYHALHRLQFKGAAKLFMEATNPLANLTDDVEKIVNLLSNGEWAEHVANTPLGQSLEVKITDLISHHNESRN
ncbi:hypothetical protein [Rosenbergiella collisarenosi]|uniref:hypothetical protein n=1 Tax=Rosenbergiella collisarenosi TaxID=1544695 RepID=UPI001F4D9ECA|nr:hypothetical protein [Rosenbergiella collisarenosi]